MTGSEESRERTEDDLRAALKTLEQQAPTVDWALRVARDPAARKRFRLAPSPGWPGWSRLAAATLAMVAVAGVALLVAAHHSGSRTASVGPARLAAWTVQRDPGGTIKVSIRELRDAAGLQARLRADGVPANVMFLQHSFTPTTSASAIPRSCRAPQMSDKANATLQEKIMPFPGPFAVGPNSVVLVIHPSAIPAGIGLFIEAFAASPGTTGSGFALQTDLVQASPLCTGAPVRSTAIRHRPAMAEPSVQQILLTAAASAQRTPAGSGTYWYVRVRAATGNGNKLYLAESWTNRDGQTWIRDQKRGTPIELPRSPGVLGPFFLGGRELTFRQLQHLPADPAALTKWITTNAARHGGKTGGPAPSKARERQDVFDSLISLLSELPATPQVRAAAFRALAALPGVTSLGQVGGGQGVRFTLLGGQPATLIIDPATGQIRATNFFVDNQGAEFWQQIPDATITGRWTSTLP
jgi:hypothetical protein